MYAENFTENPQTKQEIKSTEWYVPYWRKIVRLLVGQEKPPLFTQIVFFISLIIAFIFEIWSLISFFILKNPAYLKENKRVDVLAIVELRGRELEMDGELFVRNIQYFHLIAIGTWGLALIGLLLFWRQIKIAHHILLGSVMAYLIAMFALLGSTYFVEDTTSFDKIVLVILCFLFVIHYVLQELKERKNKQEMDEENDLDQLITTSDD